MHFVDLSINSVSLSTVVMLKEKLLDEANNDQNIYISIDHLKHGNYIINIMLNDQVVKSVRINKKTS